MVTRVAAVALLCSAVPLAAQVRYNFREIGKGIWELRRDGIRVDEIHPTDVGFVAEGKTAIPPTPVVAIDTFGRNWRSTVDAVRQFPAASTEKLLYIAFLKRKYGYQISAVNAAYGIDASSFTELESADFTRVSREKLAADDLEFAAEYYAAQLEVLRSENRTRLFLVFLRPEIPPALWEAVSGVAAGFLVRSASNFTGNSRPVVLAARICPTVRPSQFAACARISEP